MSENYYSPEYKLKVVLESLRSDETDKMVAAAHDLHPETLLKWKAKLKEDGAVVFDDSGEESVKPTGSEVDRSDEEWKSIPKYEDRYEVSNYGRIRSKERKVKTSEGYFQKRKSKVRKLSKDDNGYFKVTLQGNGSPESFFVHRLVAELFVPNPESLPVVHHKDGDTSNNKSENLEWVSRKKNTRRAVTNGEYKTGEEHHRSQLTKENVLDIRRMYYTTGYTQKDLADEFGVTRSNISSIVTGRTWTSVAQKDNYPTGKTRESGVKLTEDDVLMIRREFESGDASCEELADLLDVTTQTVKNVVRGDTWSHIEA